MWRRAVALQRVIPGPATTHVGNDGVTYRFPNRGLYPQRCDLQPSRSLRAYEAVGTAGQACAVFPLLGTTQFLRLKGT
jgi:hypothetical protein